MTTETTPDQIAQHYSAAMDSVRLINALKDKRVLAKDEADTVTRNKAHLKSMIGKDYWTTEDLAPLIAAAK